MLSDTTATYLKFTARAGDEKKDFAYVRYHYSGASKFILSEALYDVSTMNDQKAKELLDKYGFTKNQKFGLTSENGGTGCIAEHSTRPITMYLTWMAYGGEELLDRKSVV